MWAESFLPQVQHDTQVLIIGSMPGVKSLAEQQYYAHPRNAFWPIMQTLFDIPATAAYKERLVALNANKVGLWDVYAQCYREGSLDSAIATDTAQCNDFKTLFKQFPDIHSIFFNGKAAEKAFKQHIVLNETGKQRQFYGLPSTSPANAVINLQGKLKAWQAIKESIHHAG